MLELHKENNVRSRLLRCLRDPLPRVIDHFCSEEAVTNVRSLLSEGHYDMLAVDEICMSPYAEKFSGPKLVMRQKIDYLHYREVASTQPFGKEKCLQHLEATRLKFYEKRVSKSYQAAVCCSEDDAGEVRRMNPSIPITVIGNGVDLNYFVSREESHGPPTLLYTGTMHYYPNVDAVQFFFQQIYPHLIRLVPQVRILIVGHNPPAEVLQWQKLPGVTITGSVPDIRPYLAECTVSMVPLRLGGGTRLKIMESIAAGRAVVSTSVGAEGVGMRHGEHLLIADDPAEFAGQAAVLLRDAKLRGTLVKNARPYVKSHFSWEVLGKRFEAACGEMVRGRIR